MGKKCKSDNFWTRKIAECGYTFKDLSPYLKVHMTTVRYYFVGKILPADDKIKDLCEFFGVDFDEGKAEFVKIFDAWGDTHPEYVKKISYYERRNRYEKRKSDLPKPSENTNKLRGNPGKADNFWRALRIEKNVSYETIAKAARCTPTQIKNYFSGTNMPAAKKIKYICEYFGVDYRVGKKEFKNIRNAWVAAHSGIAAPVKVAPVQTPEPIIVKETPAVTASAKAPESIMELLYGKVSFEEFNQIITGQLSEDLLRSLYGKVDFNLFMQLFR